MATTSNENLCNLSYLSDMMGGKKSIILQMINAFLEQAPRELECINQAVTSSDHETIRRYAHSMKSSVSIMGISTLMPVLQELEDLGTSFGDVKRLAELNVKLNTNCSMALTELQQLKHDYI